VFPVRAVLQDQEVQEEFLQDQEVVVLALVDEYLQGPEVVARVQAVVEAAAHGDLEADRAAGDKSKGYCHETAIVNFVYTITFNYSHSSDC
jgi:hypothetical protein